MPNKRNRGYVVRSAEDECGIPSNTGEHWDEEEAGEVDARYGDAAPADRARVLREYIGRAEYPEAKRENQDFAAAIALDAGFSEREIADLLHLKDGAVPANGWTLLYRIRTGSDHAEH